MNNYTIPCTEEQTKKALELGAPIEYAGIENLYLQHKEIEFIGESGNIECARFAIPTTEQMIGWLEEQEGIRCIEVTESFGWHYRVKKKHDDVEDWIQGTCKTRKEATLAAIDAALKYLY